MSRKSTFLAVIAAVVLVSGFGLYFSGTFGSATIGLSLRSNPSLDDGLVGHWTFDGEDMVSNVADKSGQGKHGTLQGQTATSTNPGRIGQALEFDGVDDYVSLGTGVNFNAATAMSISMWVYDEDPGTFDSFRGLIGIGTTNQRGPWIYGSSGNSHVVAQFETTTGGADDCNAGNSGEGGVPDNAWAHLVFVWDGSTCVWYTNGTLGTPDATTGSVMANADLEARIGNINGFNNWKGKFDDVRFYNRALSADEVSQLYTLGADRQSVPNQQFVVARGETTIPGGTTSVTLENGDEYTLDPRANSSNSFVRITASGYKGSGANGAEPSVSNNHSAFIVDPGNIEESFIISRGGSGSGTFSIFVTWEIIQFVGPSTSPDAIAVRDVGHFGNTNLGTGTLTITGSSTSSVVDPNQVMVIVTGQTVGHFDNDSDSTGYWTADVVSSGGGYAAQLTRISTVSSSGEDVSWAMVEFTGSNWRPVQRIEIDPWSTDWPVSSSWTSSAANNVDTKSITDLGGTELLNTSKAFIHNQFRYNARGTNPRIMSNTYHISGTNEITRRNSVSNSSESLRTNVIWIVESISPTMNVQRKSTYVSTGNPGSTPYTTSMTLDSPVSSASNASIWGEHMSTDRNAGNESMNQDVAFYLADEDTVEATIQLNAHNRWYAVEVVEWPTLPTTDIHTISTQPNVPELKEGLVGHWTFNGPDMLQNIADVSGQGNHGALQGQTSTSTRAGKIGQALVLDGGDDWVDATYVGLGTDPAFTVSAWVYRTESNLADFPNLVAFGLSSAVTDRAMALHMRSGGEFAIGTKGGTYVDSTTVSETNRWYHVVGTYTGSQGTYRIYINGEEEDSQVESSPFPNLGTSRTAIGADIGGAAQFFGGYIDDVRIYNRVLNADEVARLYELGR